MPGDVLPSLPAACAPADPEYDQHYGKPLGRAVQTTDPPGWKREFEGCTVTVTADLLNASIAFHSHD